MKIGNLIKPKSGTRDDLMALLSNEETPVYLIVSERFVRETYSQRRVYDKMFGVLKDERVVEYTENHLETNYEVVG